MEQNDENFFYILQVYRAADLVVIYGPEFLEYMNENFSLFIGPQRRRLNNY